METRPTQPFHRWGLWILLGVFLLQFLLCFNPDALAWDGAFYYANARSLIFDGDLHLGNDLVLSYSVTPPDFASAHFEQQLTSTGYVANPFAIGTSLLWLPWFAAVRTGVRLAGLSPDTLTGYEWYFRWTMAAATCVYGWLAVLTTYRLLRRMSNASSVLIATVAIMASTPLVYYQFQEPFCSHPASAMAIAFLVAAWWRHAGPDKPITWQSALGLGALTGLAALIRTQNLLYLVLPALSALACAADELRRRDWRCALLRLAAVPLAAASALLVLSPQFAVWRVQYSQAFLVPQGPGFLRWYAPWLRQVIFSPYHGLLTWLPLSLPAFAGLVVAARHRSRTFVPLILALLLQVYVNSCVWFGGGGYGPRHFSDTIIVLALGYACLLSLRKTPAYRLAGMALTVLLVAHQWLILRYGFADHIGGYVVWTGSERSGQPDSILQFIQQLTGYLPLLWRQPWRTLILPGAPLDTARAAPFAATIQVALLVAVLSVAHAALAACRYLVHLWNHHRPTKFAGLAVLGCAVLLADIWLLTAA